jgi:hypothetical protein
VLGLSEEALDRFAYAAERRRKVRSLFAVGLGRDVGDCALAFDQIADSIAVIGRVSEHNGARC